MPVFRSIRAVTFDVGGTLLAPHPSVGTLYARASAAFSTSSISSDLLDARFRDAWSGAQPFLHCRENWEKLVDEVFAGLLEHPPSRTFFPDLYTEFGRASAWRLFEDVLPTLDALAAEGFDLGIISNWDDRLRPLLRELRVDRYFNCVVISCETGFAKPSPVVFEEALRQLGHPAAAVLHIGDSLHEDFGGATGAGLPALHLRRDATSQEHQIQSLDDLVPRVLDPPVRAHARPVKFLSSED